MEIQRKIVESYNPPSNKEVWWFDSNTEVLKRHLGDSWVPVSTENIPSTESGTVIETTYAEAKALYESGNMIPGVYYQFDYEHKIRDELVFVSDYDESGGHSVDSFVNYTISLKVYIDNKGNLKATSSYYSDMINDIRSFISDYSFEPKYLNISFREGDTGNTIYSCEPFKNQEVAIADYEVADSFINQLSNMLNRDIKYVFDELNYKTHIYIPNVVVYVTENEDLDWFYHIITPDGIHVEIYLAPNDKGRYVVQMKLHDKITDLGTGCVYNLDYGEYKHSFLVDILDVRHDSGAANQATSYKEICIFTGTVIQDEFKPLVYRDLTNSDFFVAKISGRIENSTLIILSMDIEIWLSIYSLDSTIVFRDYTGDVKFDSEATEIINLISPQGSINTSYIGLKCEITHTYQ